MKLASHHLWWDGRQFQSISITFNHLQSLSVIFNHCQLETSLVSRWEGVRLPRASGNSLNFPPNFPWKFFGDFSGSSLTVELNSNPEVPLKFPRLPQKFPGRPRKFPGGQPLPLGSLIPSPDSLKLSKFLWGLKSAGLYWQPEQLTLERVPTLNTFRGQISPWMRIGLMIVLKENFPSEGSFSREFSFPFPCSGLLAHEGNGLRNRSFYDLRENVWLSAATEYHSANNYYLMSYL